MIAHALTAALLVLGANPPDAGTELTEEDREIVRELELLENLDAAADLDLLEVLEDESGTQPR